MQFGLSERDRVKGHTINLKITFMVFSHEIYLNTPTYESFHSKWNLPKACFINSYEMNTCVRSSIL